MTLTTVKRFFSKTPQPVKLGFVMLITGYVFFLMTMWIHAGMNGIDSTYPDNAMGYLLSGLMLIVLGMLCAMIIGGIHEFSQWVLRKFL